MGGQLQPYLACLHLLFYLKYFLMSLEFYSFTVNCARGSTDGSVVKSTGCSYGGAEFNSQQLLGGSQPSMMESDAFF